MLFGKKRKKEESKVPIIDADSFNEFIGSSENAVIDCYNDHCVPCRRIHPMIEQLSEKYPKIAFGKLNTDYSVEVAVRYGVMSVPTILMFKKSKLIASMREVKSIEHLEKEILEKLEVKA